MKIQSKTYNKSLWKTGVLFIMISALSMQSMKAQLSDKYEGYEQRVYKGMPYGLFKPVNYNPDISYPLIVYLHGSTDTVSRDILWYKESIQSINPSFVLSPKTTEANLGWGDTWNNTNGDAQKKVMELVDILVEQYNINTSRLYIYGISMGAFGVFSVLSNYPEKFAAAYAVCGGSSINVADKMLSTPLWIFHGEMDDVVPVRFSREIYNEIVKLGGKKVKYTEYPGVKHNSWENVSQEKELGNWLFSYERGK
ncbi:prolyl oligopeptidase family serine peptidase [Algoriphagus sp. D3-2-R+10]|uniref:carboxylesterase family protein n=1 Tax=Algoriphagus aurantiacus TaxID=3103948 RepID=UPI002B3A401A|nr:prolyl oligopeptidase family serine peptidase [Algoriphagus sp. D3-2-R+10]MEB2776393.1 prolyl oligopeptidase family serine peptidase [Algoriphagus sp. D3-2-R+10]